MTSRPLLPRAAHGALLLGLAVLSAAGTAQAHEGGLGNAVMWQACQGHQIDEPCVFQSLDHDVFRGSCQSMSNALVCVRNQPIQRAANWTHSHAPDPAPGTTPVQARRWPWLAGGPALLACGLGLGLTAGLARFKLKRTTAA